MRCAAPVATRYPVLGGLLSYTNHPFGGALLVPAKLGVLLHFALQGVFALTGTHLRTAEAGHAAVLEEFIGFAHVKVPLSG